MLAVQFNTALFASHFVWMTSGLQVICGALLLIDRYVPLALPHRGYFAPLFVSRVTTT